MPYAPLPLYSKDPWPRRFLIRVDVGEPDECWEWKGNSLKSGYGIFHSSRANGYAHRYSYELLIGPIPEGLVIDHLCRNPGCVNPSHLEPVTNRENILRGMSLAARYARRTHCINGHEFTPENTRLMPGGDRQCRPCRRHREWVRRERRKALA